MNLKTLSALAIIALLAIGCGDNKTAETGGTPATLNSTADKTDTPASDNKLVGEWTVKEMPGMAVEFKDDGTMTANMEMPGQAGMMLYSSSTYKVDGDKITTKGTEAKVEGGEEKVRKAVEDSSKAALGTEVSGTLKWNSDDEFVITPDVAGATAYTYIRKK